MPELSNATLAHLGPDIRVPAYDRAGLKGGIVHFGVGNFHRTQLAVYVEDALARTGDLRWGIVGVGLTAGQPGQDKAAAYRAQDNLYTVTEFSPTGRASTRVIGAMRDYLHAPEPGRGRLP